MSLLFKLNEWLNNAGVDFDTADLMEHAIQARNKMIKWANVLTNLMHFSLCFGFVAMILRFANCNIFRSHSYEMVVQRCRFVADFIVNYSLGMFDAVPWAGLVSLLLAIVTPVQGTIGALSDMFTARSFVNRLREVKVMAALQVLVPHAQLD
jgi:hypothetical protein